MSPEHAQRRPIGRASEETPLSGVPGIEGDELKSRVMLTEIAIANFNKVGAQVDTMQQQVFSMVKPLTDKNAELETKITELESLNHDLSERMTDMQLKIS